MRTYENIKTIATGQEDDYITGRQNYKLIAMDLSKQQALVGNPKAIFHFSLILLQI